MISCERDSCSYLRPRSLPRIPFSTVRIKLPHSISPAAQPDYCLLNGHSSDHLHRIDEFRSTHRLSRLFMPTMSAFNGTCPIPATCLPCTYAQNNISTAPFQYHSWYEKCLSIRHPCGAFIAGYMVNGIEFWYSWISFCVLFRLGLFALYWHQGIRPRRSYRQHVTCLLLGLLYIVTRGIDLWYDAWRRVLQRIMLVAFKALCPSAELPSHTTGWIAVDTCEYPANPLAEYLSARIYTETTDHANVLVDFESKSEKPEPLLKLVPKPIPANLESFEPCGPLTMEDEMFSTSCFLIHFEHVLNGVVLAMVVIWCLGVRDLE